MSTGGAIGAIVGGLVGAALAPWTGGLSLAAMSSIMYGASFGLAIGMMIDPMTPDISGLGIPDQQENIMSAEVGTPLPDLAGTAKITGHLLFYGNERSEPVYYTSSSSGGKGTDAENEKRITGYRYYMTWGLGICVGPIDTLFAVYRNEDLVWSGELDAPVSGGKETIVLTTG